MKDNNEVFVAGVRMWSEGDMLYMQTPDGRIARIPRDKLGPFIEATKKFAENAKDGEMLMLDLSPFTINN